MAAPNSKGSSEERLECTPIEGMNPDGFFNENASKGSCSVRVAVRVRPLLPKELAAGDSSCVRSDPSHNSLVVGLDKRFGFDKVFGIDSKQEEVFDVCVKNLVLSSFAGYNSTVLAYGQTGSGKTFTMGTDAVLTTSKEQQGIIPRVIHMIFDEVEKRKENREVIIKVSFIEVYNEEIRDLLDPQGQSKIVIRELTRGIPSLCGQREERVIDYDELFKFLEKGALHRRTRSTLMNESSSRSHAIFTINIEQHLIEDLYQSSPTEGNSTQEFTTAKFHFVDLAGSERVKKTGAEGDTLHEGISINKALFVLGKVINALTDETGRNTYKPYRESSLTRILQDSLGGNARTTMIACVSPAESNQEETLSTLLYACKARSIKNKPVINKDPNSTLIHQLQQQVYDLQRELSRYRKGGSVPLPLSKPGEGLADLPSEKEFKAEIASLKRQNEGLKANITQLEDQCRKREIEFLEIQKERDVLKMQNDKLKELVSKHLPADQIDLAKLLPSEEELDVVEGYRKQIEGLQAENKKKSEEIVELRIKYEEECKNANWQSEQMLKLNQELQQLKRTLVKLRKEGVESAKVKVEGRYSDEYEKDTGAGPWLSAELDEQLKEVNEMFINDLAQSLGTLITDTTKEFPEQKTVVEETASTIHEELEVTTEDPEDVKKETEAETEMKETLNKVEGDIHEREKMLEQIKEKHKGMQKALLSIMEQQYHKKVEELEKEMEKLKSDQEKAMQLVPKDNRGAVEKQYRKKIGEYEAKIKEYRRNQSSQQKLMKQTSEQEDKIHVLTEEITKMKQQKVELTRQMRRERENYEKNKREQLRQALKLKQETIKQKMLITKLTKEKERAAKLKENAKLEVMRMPGKEQLVNYRDLINNFSNRLVNLRQESAQMQKEEQKQKGLKARLNHEYDNMCKVKFEAEKLELLLKELNLSTDYDKIKAAEESLDSLHKLLSEQQTGIDNLEATLRYHEEKAARINQTRILLRTQLANLLGKGKIRTTREMNDLITVLFEVLAEEKLKREEETAKSKIDQSTIATLTENIENLAKANKLLQEEFVSELANMREMFAAKELAFKAELESLKGAQAEPDIGDLFQCNKKMILANEAKGKPDLTKEKSEDSNKDNSKFLKKELEEYKKRNTDIMKENSLLRSQIIGLTGQNEKLSKNTINLARRMDDLSSKLKKSDAGSGKSATTAVTPKLVSLKEQRLNKKTKLMVHKLSQPRTGTPDKVHLSAEVSATELTQSKDQTVEEIMGEGIPAFEEEKKLPPEGPRPSTFQRSAIGLKATTAKLVMCKPTRHQHKLAEELRQDYSRRPFTAVGRSKSPINSHADESFTFTRGTKERSNTISTPEKNKNAPREVPLISYFTAPQPSMEPNKWKCVHSEELHSFGIFSLAAFEHYLISSSNVVKLWDINKKATVTELPATNAKTLYAAHSHKMLLTASEQHGSVGIYALPDLELIQTIETGLDAVRAIYMNNNILFIGGGGSAGALQLWDVNTMTKLCEKEKNQDIFSVLCKKSVIYYGGRNRCINRISFDTLVDF